LPARRHHAVRAPLAAVNAGEHRAVAAVRTVAAALGRTIASLVNVLNPERVLLGGSFAEVFRLANSEMVQALDSHTMAASHNAVQLCSPRLGDDSSLLGAAELAFAALLADPLLSRST
ncbi:MAG: ROK family protein, partial [Pseudonocardiales bacterium]